jgi:hypothetical protein
MILKSDSILLAFSDNFNVGTVNTNPATLTNASSENIDYINYLQHIDFNVKLFQLKNKYIGSSQDLKSQFVYPEAILNLSYIQNADFFNEKKFGLTVNSTENSQSSISQLTNSFKNKIAYILIKDNLHYDLINYIFKNDLDTSMKFFLFKNLYLTNYNLNYSVGNLPIVKVSFSSEDLNVGNLTTGASNSIATYPYVIKDAYNNTIGLRKNKVPVPSAPKTFVTVYKVNYFSFSSDYLDPSKKPLAIDASSFLNGYIQNLDIGIDFKRNNFSFLFKSTNKPIDKKLIVPIMGNLKISGISKNFINGNLQDIFSQNLKFNIQIGILNKYQNKIVSTGSKIFINNLIVESFSYQVDSLGVLAYTMDCSFQMNDLNNDGLNFTLVP